MTQLIDFFLKTNNGPSTRAEPPFLLNFQMPAEKMPEARARAREIIQDSRGHLPGLDDDQVARRLLADAILNNGHMAPQLQPMLGMLMVEIIAAVDKGREAIERGAKQVGLLFSPGMAQEQATMEKAMHAGGVGILMGPKQVEPTFSVWASD